MAREHHKPEEIVVKLRQVEVLVGQGKPVAERVRAIGVTEATYYRWRAEYGGLEACHRTASWPVLVIMRASPHRVGEPDLLLVAGSCRRPARNLGH